MNKYQIIFEKEFLIKANTVEEAEQKAKDICANDSEALMPYNMEITTYASTLPNSFFE